MSIDIQNLLARIDVLESENAIQREKLVRLTTELREQEKPREAPSEPPESERKGIVRRWDFIYDHLSEALETLLADAIVSYVKETYPDINVDVEDFENTQLWAANYLTRYLIHINDEYFTLHDTDGKPSSDDYKLARIAVLEAENDHLRENSIRLAAILNMCESASHGRI